MVPLKKITPLPIYKKIVCIIINFLIFIMLLTLLGAIAGLIVDYFSTINTLIHSVPPNPLHTSHTLISNLGHTLVVDILSVFILIELFRTFTDYLEVHRIRLSVLAEFGFVFILRDIFIGLYADKIAWQEIVSLSVVLAVLAATRILSSAFPPKN